MYKIDFLYKHPRKKFINIKLEIETKSLSKKVYLQLPVWRPGRYEHIEYIKNIQKMNITDSNGNKLSYKRNSNSTFELIKPESDKIIIKYNYFANKIDAGSCFIDKETFYVNPVNCCFYVIGREDEPVILNLELPERFKRTSIGLGCESKLKFSSIHQLFDTPIMASENLKHDGFEIEGVEINLWFCGEVKPDYKKLIPDFKKFCRYQISKMECFPEKIFDFLFMIVPFKFHHGVEHKKSTVITLGPGYALMDKNNLYNELLGVSSHEFFHVWNVKYLRPKAMMPYDYSKPKYSGLGFVYEGFTTYLGDYFLLKSGVLNWKEFTKQIEKNFNLMFQNYGRFNKSVYQSSIETWIDGYEKGVPDRKVSIYTKGAIIAFLIDFLIRKETNHEYDIVSIIKKMYQDKEILKYGYTLEDVKTVFMELTKNKYPDFFLKYIEGIERLDPLIKKAFKYIGCEFLENPHQSITASKFGFFINPIDMKVLKIHPESPMIDKISIGYKLICINNIHVSAENYNHWLDYFLDKNRIMFSFLTHNSVLETFNVRWSNKDAYYKSFEIKKIKSPTSFQENNFNIWMAN